MSALEAGELFTTGCWYYRLSRAIHDRRSVGALSREFAELPDDDQHQVLAALDDLPERIGLVSLRSLVPIMAVLDLDRPLNLLAAEAVASALLTSAPIAVTTDNPGLREACSVLDIQYALVTG
jgi:hypothetical protein